MSGELTSDRVGVTWNNTFKPQTWIWFPCLILNYVIINFANWLWEIKHIFFYIVKFKSSPPIHSLLGGWPAGRLMNIQQRRRIIEQKHDEILNQNKPNQSCQRRRYRDGWCLLTFNHVTKQHLNTIVSASIDMNEVWLWYAYCSVIRENVMCGSWLKSSSQIKYVCIIDIDRQITP